MSLVIKFIFFTNSAVVVTSLVRSHVVFKLLNYVTDKIVRVALTTLARMLTCVRERESMCFPYIKRNFVAKTWI